MPAIRGMGGDSDSCFCRAEPLQKNRFFKPSPGDFVDVVLNKCLIILLFGSLLCPLTVSAEPIFIHFTLSQRSDEFGATAAAYLKKLLEQRSGGRIRVSVSQGSPPPPGQQTLEDLRSNRYQLVLIDAAFLAPTESALTLFDQPFLFDNVAHFHRFLDSPAGAGLLEDLSHDGIIALSLWDQGFRQLIADVPLLTPQDVTGKVLGSQKPTASSKGLENLGAEIRHLDHLQPGGDEGLNGFELTLSQIAAAQFLPAHLTLSNHAVETQLLLSNQNFWAGVSEEMKVIVQGAIRDAALYSRELASQARAASLKRLTASQPRYIYPLTRAQRQTWRKALVIRQTPESARIDALRLLGRESQP